ncbi:MAG TPA: EamA family transporter [Myxococcota bacterium]|nr:EamA family transporter [Myxococcota bacterium]
MSPTDLAIVLASALLHALWSVSIKQSGDPLCFNLLQTWIGSIGLACVAPFVPWRAIPAEVWALVLLTGPTHALYLYWMSRAFEHGELSLVYPIARSTPAFLPLVAVPLFGEALRPVGALGIAMVVLGMWLVHLGPGFERQALAGPATRFALLTLLATVAYSLIDKAAMARLASGAWPGPVPRAITYSLLLQVAHALAFAPLFFRARSVTALRAAAREQLARAAAAAAISFVGYALILRAFETALASYVVAVRQSSVLFAVALGALWLRERPSRPRLFGAAATVAGVAMIAIFGKE